MPTASEIIEFLKTQEARDREIAREIARLAQKAKTLEVEAASLRDSLMALLPPTVATGDVPNGGPPRHKAVKRGAVKATAVQADLVLTAMQDIGEPVSVKQLRGGTGLGPKVIGAALRLLFTNGRVEGALPGGKWALSPIEDGDDAVAQGVNSEIGSKD